MSKTYEEIVNIIQQKRRFGQASGFEVSTELLSLLGNPEKGMKVIHIAGTNGKGSTAAFISNILKAADFCVGQFTSPHLIDFTERIQINGMQIPKEKVVEYGTQVLELEPQLLEKNLAPTMFDICLAIALLYYKEKNCDFVVLETGLGGRLDSTRALLVTPVVSVFTNIGLDHTTILGNSIEEIAGEKAGILKKGTTAVISSMECSAQQVIESKCKERNIISHTIDASVSFPWVKSYRLGLLGDYQQSNAKTAVETVLLLEEKHGDLFLDKYLSSVRGIGDEPCTSGCDGKCEHCETNQKPSNFVEWKKYILRQGLEHANWPGRMELVCKEPWMLLDGAHNPQGVKALAKSLQVLNPSETYIFIAGVMADKNYEEMMDEMIPLAQKFITVTVENSRALQGDALAEYIRRQGVEAFSVDNIPAALEMAKDLSHVNKRAKIVAFGSLYFIGEVKEYLAHDN